MTQAVMHRVQNAAQVAESTSTKAKAGTDGSRPPAALYAIFGQKRPPPRPRIDKSKLRHQKAIHAFDAAVKKEDENQKSASHLEDHNVTPTADPDDGHWALEDGHPQPGYPDAP